MQTVNEKVPGVTLAFAATAVLVVVLLVGLDAAGAGGDFTRGVDNWPAVGAAIIGTSTMAGAVVDVLRWIGNRLWPGDRKTRLPIGKVINQNLV